MLILLPLNEEMTSTRNKFTRISPLSTIVETDLENVFDDEAQHRDHRMKKELTPKGKDDRQSKEIGKEKCVFVQFLVQWSSFIELN